MTYDRFLGECHCGDAVARPNPATYDPNCEAVLYTLQSVVCDVFDFSPYFMKCYRCKSGYALADPASPSTAIAFSDLCVPSILHCKRHTASYTCEQCGSGSTLSNDSKACVTPIPNCVSQRADGTCIECSSGYVPAFDGGACVTAIANCGTYNTDGTCRSCSKGYSFTYDKICVRTITGCGAYNTDGSCRECAVDYSFSTNGERCVECRMRNCKSCDVSNVCAHCDDGFGVSDSGTCVACVDANCKRCTDNGNTCAEYLVAEDKKGNGLPWWAYLCIVVGAILIIGLIAYFIVALCKSNRSEDLLTTSMYWQYPAADTAEGNAREWKQRRTSAREGGASDCDSTGVSVFSDDSGYSSN
ncbi:hypothetical protein AGDE_15510 [Angomonas deanei]|uniref:Uncharacterized protein n=1 Tax=Angomonas deanei TaxID=59799 RepID=A0A7G2CQW6_9TRYP|nr:hypothetical protein AGDE_15510 [Angomonas deanei]CAD2221537.1 hypothetical protein, conserved [Angomonas deanei]|eukprot:EPY18944.1 hypothetical protein AGDE_15510 [Angomonas deanei]